MLIQEQEYRAYFNDDDELMFAIKEKRGEAKNPYILYDGGPHALLYRNSEQTIFLDYLAEQARAPLAKIKQVLIAEVEKDWETIVHEYKAPVKRVARLPISNEEIITPEKYNLTISDTSSLAKIICVVIVLIVSIIAVWTILR
jgi:hypothetical protein